MWKKTTGLTGLAVSANPRHTLLTLYGKILRVLAKMPDDAAYRKYTEELISHRMSIVTKAEDPCEIEEKIGCGQVEEIIVQAENELKLARNFLGWKAWEPLASQPPPRQWTWPPYK
ncbi:NADH dehydrogenase [ubiquinone] 1 alpha subcomplex subunit 5-like [Cimex lectularius]|uniref:NADH dehydrogenase [ubiquinone] 1 alpha subcomplex subunit 5 n=1 Tax=Cimex lectularius TaxID=79782 RepID=A0A8I6SE03_CIMLE|nr:NADH dehydrogenase [ubiquinone] 1 alpha subcomplex subunit 5-like [Cimex lectularius]